MSDTAEQPARRRSSRVVPYLIILLLVAGVVLAAYFQSEIGYFSTVDNYEKYLDPKLVKEVYGGEGRDGGSLADRAQRVFVWNTRPKNLEYYTEKWNEFLAA